MKLTLKRTTFTEQSTIGQLLVDGKKVCDTLEDVVRAPGVKIHGKTAIPSGVYKVIVNHSQRFDQDMPLLINVPNFEGVRIHPGNSAVDTEGCILVGTADKKLPNWIGQSRKAYESLFPVIRDACAKGPVLLVIEDAREPSGAAK